MCVFQSLSLQTLLIIGKGSLKHINFLLVLDDLFGQLVFVWSVWIPAAYSCIMYRMSTSLPVFCVRFHTASYSEGNKSDMKQWMMSNLPWKLKCTMHREGARLRENSNGSVGYNLATTFSPAKLYSQGIARTGQCLVFSLTIYFSAFHQECSVGLVFQWCNVVCSHHGIWL